MDVDVVLSVSPRYKSSTIGDSLGLFPIPLPWVHTLDGLEWLDTMDLPDLKCIKTFPSFDWIPFQYPLSSNSILLSLLQPLNLWSSSYGLWLPLTFYGFMVLTFFLWFSFLWSFIVFMVLFAFVFFMVFIWFLGLQFSFWLSLWICLQSKIWLPKFLSFLIFHFSFTLKCLVAKFLSLMVLKF